MKTKQNYFRSFLKTSILFCIVLVPCLCHANENPAMNANQEQTSPAVQADKQHGNTPAMENAAEKNSTEQTDTIGKPSNPEHKNPLFQKEEVQAFSWGSYFKAIGIMLFLLLVFWYVLKIVKRYGNGKFLPNQKLLPRDSMYLEGQIPLGQGKSIVIIKVLDERLVLGVTEHNINLLTKTGLNNEQNSNDSEQSHQQNFEELLRQA